MSNNRVKNLKDRLNLVAVSILIFNFTHPHLAAAAPEPSVQATEPVLMAEPGSKLVREANKPMVVKAVITAYTSTPDQTDGDPFITASGKRVEYGTIAANGVPFGTVVKIPTLFGDTRFVVTDRMNERYGFGRLDVWLPGDRGEAIRFGVKRVEVEYYLPAETTLAKN